MKLIPENLQYLEVAAILKKEIENGTLVPGARLLSIRHMAERFGVGRQVVLSAFNRLAEDGYTVSAHGRGTFVNPAFRKPVPPRRLGFYIHEGTLSGSHATRLFEECCQECVQAGYDLLLAGSNHKIVLRDWCAMLDGLIVTGNVDDRLVEKLRATGVPFVVSGNYDLSDAGVYRVELDIDTLLRALLDAAASLGPVRTVGAIIGDLKRRASRDMALAIRRWCESRGLAWTDRFICADDGPVGYKMSHRLLANPDDRPDAIFATPDAYLELGSYIYEHGLLEDRPLVVTMCEDVRKMPFRSVADVVASGSVVHGALCFSLLNDILEGCAPDTATVVPRLVLDIVRRR